jgi:hypothetical protein
MVDNGETTSFRFIKEKEKYKEEEYGYKQNYKNFKMAVPKSKVST